MKLPENRHRNLMILLVSFSLLAGCSIPAMPAPGQGLTAETSSAGTVKSSSSASGGNSSPGAPPPPVTAGGIPSDAKTNVTVPLTSASGEVFPSGAVVGRRLMGNIRTLDPHRIGLSSEEELVRYLFGSLFQHGADPSSGSPVILPYHAAGLPETADQRSYIIRLRPDMTWSDGSALTARDYEWSMQQLLDPKAENSLAIQYTSYLPIRGAALYQSGAVRVFAAVGFRALDDWTIQVDLDAPRTPEEVARALTMPMLLDRSAYERAKSPGSAPYGEAWQSLNFSGAYELKAFIPGQSMTLERRTDPGMEGFFRTYFTFDYLFFKQYDSNLSAMEAFYRGELDLVPVAGRSYKKLSEDPRLRVALSNTVWGIYLNWDEPVLADQDFRRALYWGTDRTKIAVGIFGSYHSYSGFIGPQSLVHKGNRLTGYRKTRESLANAAKANVYDPDKAQGFAALAKSRMGEPVSLELIIPGEDAQMLAMGEILKENWEALFEGRLEIRITPLSLREAYERYRSGAYQMGFGAMGQDVFDPWHSMMAFRSDFPGKLDQMKSPLFDALHDESNREEVRADSKRRLELLSQMEAHLLEELPQIPLFVNADSYLISDALELPFKKYIPGVGFGLDQAKPVE